MSKRSSGRTSKLGSEIEATPALLTRLAEPLPANSSRRILRTKDSISVRL